MIDTIAALASDFYRGQSCLCPTWEPTTRNNVQVMVPGAVCTRAAASSPGNRALNRHHQYTSLYEATNGAA